MGFGSPNAGEKLEHFVGLFVDLVLFGRFLIFPQVAAFYAGKGGNMQNILHYEGYYRKIEVKILLLQNSPVKIKHENVIFTSISLPPFGKYPYSGG
mgnify:CR=1 FL=1